MSTNWREETINLMTEYPDFYRDPLWNRQGDPSPLVRDNMYHIIRHHYTLHYLAEHFGRRKKSLDAPVYHGLVLGIFQIIYCPDIPHYAALNSTVEAVKKVFHKGGSSFVNAILRNLQREMTSRGKLPKNFSEGHRKILPLTREEGIFFDHDLFPSPLEDLTEYFRCVYSHPLWLIRRLVEEFGPEKTEEILLENNNPSPPLFGRINLLKSTPPALQDELAREEVPFHPTPLAEVIEIERGVEISSLASFKEGKLYFQDLNALRLLAESDLGDPASILDLCAAPGGKLSYLAGRFPKADLVGIDLSEGRLERTRENLDRLGVSARLEALDATEMEGEGKPFDLILVDVPCSNTGVLRRRPEARWRVTPDDVKKLVDLQTRLLKKATELVAPGGRILYSTCSVLSEENGKVVERVLAESENLKKLEEKLYLPGEDRGDGAYSALLVSPPLSS